MNTDQLQNIQSLIKETIETEGWKIIEKMYFEMVESLDTIRGVESVKDILARKHAIKILEGWINYVISLANNPVPSAKNINKPIYKVVKSAKDIS